MRELFESALRGAAQRRHRLRLTDLGGQVMIQVTRKPRAAARSAIYRDLSFFFDLKSIRQRDLRSQAIAVPSSGGPGAVTQISAALELVGWSVSHPPAPVTKWPERIWNGPLDAGYTNVRIIIEIT